MIKRAPITSKDPRMITSISCQVVGGWPVAVCIVCYIAVILLGEILI